MCENENKFVKIVDKNEIKFISPKDIESVEMAFKDRDDFLFCDIFGAKIQSERDFCLAMIDAFCVPYVYDEHELFYEWFYDFVIELSWLKVKVGVALLVREFDHMLTCDSLVKSWFLEDMRDSILPWWRLDVVWHLGGGFPRNFKVFCVVDDVNLWQDGHDKFDALIDENENISNVDGENLCQNMGGFCGENSSGYKLIAGSDGSVWMHASQLELALNKSDSHIRGFYDDFDEANIEKFCCDKSQGIQLLFGTSLGHGFVLCPACKASAVKAEKTQAVLVCDDATCQAKFNNPLRQLFR